MTSLGRRGQSPDSGSSGAVSIEDRNTSAAGRLTPREMDVMRCLALGKGAGECATALGINVSTVKRHTQLIHAKLRVSGTVEAMWALGWVVIG